MANSGGQATKEDQIVNPFTQPDWCGICVVERIKKHGRFNGSDGLFPAVTTIRSTRVCGRHADVLLQRVLEEAELEVRSWAS